MNGQPARSIGNICGGCEAGTEIPSLAGGGPARGCAGGPTPERLRRDRRSGRRVVVPDFFHPILQLQFAFLQGDFLELFVVGEVVLGGECLQAVLEFVVPGCEVAVFVAGLQQACGSCVSAIVVPPPFRCASRMDPRPCQGTLAPCPGRFKPIWGLPPEHQRVLDGLAVIVAPDRRLEESRGR